MDQQEAQVCFLLRSWSWDKTTKSNFEKTRRDYIIFLQFILLKRSSALFLPLPLKFC